MADRTAEMMDGAERVREPSFKTVQQQHEKYVRNTVLGQIMPSANGLSQIDLQRSLQGKVSQGASESTKEATFWLRNPAPSIYKTFG